MYNSMLLSFCISLYITGCIVSLYLYMIILYEKYNNKQNKFNKKDIKNGMYILFSWLYIANFISINRKLI